MPPKRNNTSSSSRGRDTGRGSSRSHIDSGGGMTRAQTGGDSRGRSGSRSGAREKTKSTSTLQGTNPPPLQTSPVVGAKRSLPVDEGSPATFPAANPLPNSVRALQSLKEGRSSATTTDNTSHPPAIATVEEEVVQIPDLNDDTQAPTVVPEPRSALTEAERANRATLLLQTAEAHTNSPSGPNSPDRAATMEAEAAQEVVGAVQLPITPLINHITELLGSINQRLQRDNDAIETYKARATEAYKMAVEHEQNIVIKRRYKDDSAQMHNTTARADDALPAFSMVNVKNAVQRKEYHNQNIDVRETEYQQAEAAVNKAEEAKRQNKDPKNINALNITLNKKKSELPAAAHKLAKAYEDAATSTSTALRVMQAAANKIRQLSDTRNLENAQTAFALAATLADINRITVAFPGDTAPRIEALKRNMKSEDHTRIGFEIEGAWAYKYDQQHTDKLGNIVNKTLYEFVPAGADGKPILEMLLDDIKDNGEAQIEFRTTPLEFESINRDLSTKIRSAINGFTTEAFKNSQEISVEGGVWRPTQVRRNPDNVFLQDVTNNISIAAPQNLAQHATVSIELGAFAGLTAQQKGLLYPSGVGAATEADLMHAIYTQSGADSIDATTTGRNGARAMVKTPVEAILAVMPEGAIPQMPVGQVDISAKEQDKHVIPNAATGVGLIRSFGSFPGIQGEHGIGYRAIAEKLQPPLLDPVSGGIRVLVEHRGGSNLANAVNGALGGNNLALNGVANAAQAMDASRTNPQSRVTSTGGTPADTGNTARGQQPAIRDASTTAPPQVGRLKPIRTLGRVAPVVRPSPGSQTGATQTAATTGGTSRVGGRLPAAGSSGSGINAVRDRQKKTDDQSDI